MAPPTEPKELAPGQAVQESVAAQPTPFWGGYVSTLLPWADDLQADFGDDIYDRMLLDPQVYSSLDILIKGVLADGVQVTAARKEGDPEHEAASSLADFCRRNLARVQNLTTQVLPDMLRAIAHGHRIAEQVFEIAPDGPDRGKLVLKALKPKPRRTLAFVVDPFMNVLGLLNQTFPRGAALSNADADRLLPRRKFAVLTWRPDSCDPRGTSGFRCVYDPWWRKYQVIGEWLKYIAQFGSGSIFAILGPEARAVLEIDPHTGEIQYETDGVTPKVKDPVRAAMVAIQAIRNGSAAAFPHGYEVGKLEMQGNGEAFVTALDRCDRDIERAVLNQTLATSEAQHQARASSEVHQDTKGTVVKFAKACVAAMLQYDVLAPLVEDNFGREALALLPQVSLGDTEAQDVPKMLTALAKLGYKLHPSQFQELDAANGIPRRPDDAVEDEIKAQKNARPAPDAGPGSTPPGEDDEREEDADDEGRS